MGTIGQDVTRSIKSTAKGSGKKVLQEPLEILKTANVQATGGERTHSHFDSKEFYEKSEQKDTFSSQDMDEIEARRRKMLEDLEDEIKAISKEREEKDRKRKEALAQRQQDAKLQQSKNNEDLAVASKPSRRIRLGMPGKLDKLRRKSEIRMPPSG